MWSLRGARRDARGQARAHDPRAACAKQHYVIGAWRVSDPGMPEEPMR